jgi:hypothetical protein
MLEMLYKHCMNIDYMLFLGLMLFLDLIAIFRIEEAT